MTLASHLLMSKGTRDQQEQVSAEAQYVETQLGVQNLGFCWAITEYLRRVQAMFFCHKSVDVPTNERKVENNHDPRPFDEQKERDRTVENHLRNYKHVYVSTHICRINVVCLQVTEESEKVHIYEDQHTIQDQHQHKEEEPVKVGHPKNNTHL